MQEESSQLRQWIERRAWTGKRREKRLVGESGIKRRDCVSSKDMLVFTKIVWLFLK